MIDWQVEVHSLRVLDLQNEWLRVEFSIKKGEEITTAEVTALQARLAPLVHERDSWRTNSRKVELDLTIAKSRLTKLVKALGGHDRGMLQKKIDYLKTTDGEGWAIGELAQRALDALEGEYSCEGCGRAMVRDEACPRCVAEIEPLVAERDGWKEDALRYAQNSGYWKGKYTRLVEAARDLRMVVLDLEHDSHFRHGPCCEIKPACTCDYKAKENLLWAALNALRAELEVDDG